MGSCLAWELHMPTPNAPISCIVLHTWTWFHKLLLSSMLQRKQTASWPCLWCDLLLLELIILMSPFHEEHDSNILYNNNTSSSNNTSSNNNSTSNTSNSNNHNHKPRRSCCVCTDMRPCETRYCSPAKGTLSIPVMPVDNWASTTLGMNGRHQAPVGQRPDAFHPP